MFLKTQLRPALSLFIALSLITGIAYPLLTTGLARILFPDQAAGSLLRQGGVSVGSSLIGQNFTRPGYFWSRPSATGNAPYNGQASSGSNLGPTNPALAKAWSERAVMLRQASPAQSMAIPVDLLTASASGLDPHISPAAARWQAPRVAAARGLPLAVVEQLISAQTSDRLWGLFGEPVVNVLALNIALDRLSLRK